MLNLYQRRTTTSTKCLTQALDRAATTAPTYSDLGSTLSGGELPPGYNFDYYEVNLGTGITVYERAVKGLRGWRAHDLPGISVYPPDVTIKEGQTVIVCMGKFVALAAPCRIVKVISETARWGFAYGTLPGHPEQGEESFAVNIAEDESVTWRVAG